MLKLFFFMSLLAFSPVLASSKSSEELIFFEDGDELGNEQHPDKEIEKAPFDFSGFAKRPEREDVGNIGRLRRFSASQVLPNPDNWPFGLKLKVSNANKIAEVAAESAERLSLKASTKELNKLYDIVKIGEEAWVKQLKGLTSLLSVCAIGFLFVSGYYFSEVIPEEKHKASERMVEIAEQIAEQKVKNVVNEKGNNVKIGFFIFFFVLFWLLLFYKRFVK